MKHRLPGIAMILLLATASAVVGEPVASKPVLTVDGAKVIMAAAKAEATRLDAPGGTIAIVDDGGHLILLERLEGTVPATPPVATGKARTAAIFRAPTAKFENIVSQGRTPMMAIEDFMPMQGGIPIMVDGHVIGGIGVSGAASAPQDEEIAIAGAKAAKVWNR